MHMKTDKPITSATKFWTQGSLAYPAIYALAHIYISHANKKKSEINYLYLSLFQALSRRPNHSLTSRRRAKFLQTVINKRLVSD